MAEEHEGDMQCVSLLKAGGWMKKEKNYPAGVNVVSFFSPLFAAHQSRVMMVLFVLEMEWILSIGQDKYFTWHCSESAQRLGSYRISAGACGLQYPLQALPY